MCAKVETILPGTAWGGDGHVVEFAMESLDLAEWPSGNHQPTHQAGLRSMPLRHFRHASTEPSSSMAISVEQFIPVAAPEHTLSIMCTNSHHAT